MDFTLTHGDGARNTSSGIAGGDRIASQTALLPHHLDEVRGSGLTDETVVSNGIYSESDPKKIAALLCWSTARAVLLGSVLVYPHCDRHGEPLGHATVKPDRPRNRSDKSGQVKYENPRRRPNRVYIPVGARAAVRDSGAALVITEGCKKALAATQHGFPCVALPGVWNWVAPREKKGGKKVGRLALNDDLKAIAWQGRRVWVCFDSDAVTNPEVARAERALAAELRRHGADVRVVRLPAGPQGRKNGLDDFLLSEGARFQELLAATPVAPDPGLAPRGGGFTDSGYSTERGSTYFCVLAPDEATGDLIVTKKTKLANFTARIVGETVTDDGAEQTREFTVAVEQYGKSARTVGVPVERFGMLDWVVERFGPQYVIQAGNGRRDHLRCAIQELSGDQIPTAVVYTHTGWRETGGRWTYLHGGGGIGATKPSVTAVQLDGAATNFRLPEPPVDGELTTAVRASLGMLDGLAPDRVVFPILATVYRAVLGPADYALWLCGLTGAQKSELAALAQQHFGSEMVRNRLPGNWSSTDNALEGLAFAIKDAILVIDDFAPSVSRGDADRQHRTAERLIRGQGNSAGRQRMRADGRLRPPKPPRGLIFATGEDVPRGHSITARLAVVTAQRGDVRLLRLSECQKDAADARYAGAMAGFVAWLAPRYPQFRAGFDVERVELRDQFVGKSPHARTPDIIANLLLGLRYLLTFAEAVGAIDHSRRAELWERGTVAFRALAEQQSEHLRAVDPIARFPEMLCAVLSSGRARLASLDGSVPRVTPLAWGWAPRDSHLGVHPVSGLYQPRGRRLGWVEVDEVYLDPDSVFAALAELAREQGISYPVSQQTLQRRLKENGVLVRTEGDRTTYPVNVEGKRRRVLVLGAGYLSVDPGQPGQTGSEPEKTSVSVPVSRPDSIPVLRKPGRETGTKEPSESVTDPVVPVVPVLETGDRLGPTEVVPPSPVDDVEVFTP